MQPVTLAIVDGGAITALLSGVATEAAWDYGPHGARELTISAPRQAAAIFALYRARRQPQVLALRGGAVLWAGHLDAAAMRLEAGGTQLLIRALGTWQALRHGRHTELWSDSRLSRWRPMTTEDRAARLPERFVMDQNNRLFIGLKQGQTYSNATLGSVCYELPDGAARAIVGIMFDVTYNLPATYRIRVIRYDGGLSGTPTVVNTLNGSGATIILANYSNWAPSACDAIEIVVDYNAGVGVVYAGEDGASHATIRNVRLVTSNDSTLVDTLGTTIAAGARTVSPPGGVAGIYVGQRIWISHATTPESVVVTAVGVSDFTAVFAYAHVNTDPIRAFVVYASTIAEALHAEAVALNSGILSEDISLIDGTTLDITDAVYEDALPADVLDDLAQRGDGAGGLIETGVDEQRRLYFRERGSAARTWYVRLESLELERPITAVENRVYATYEYLRYEDSTNGRTTRTPVTDDTTSQGDYGLVRVGVVEAQTSNATLAASIRDLALSDRSDPRPAASIGIRQVETANGAIVTGDQVRPGDTITIRNLPPFATGTFVDRVRTFIVSEMSYDPMTRRVSVVPETPLPLLDVLVAQGLIPS